MLQKHGHRHPLVTTDEQEFSNSDVTVPAARQILLLSSSSYQEFGDSFSKCVFSDLWLSCFCCHDDLEGSLLHFVLLCFKCETLKWERAGFTRDTRILYCVMKSYVRVHTPVECTDADSYLL